MFTGGFSLFFDIVLCIPGWLQGDYIAEGDLKILINLPPPPKSWDFRHKPCLVHVVVEIKAWASYILSKHSAH